MQFYNPWPKRGCIPILILHFNKGRYKFQHKKQESAMLNICQWKKFRIFLPPSVGASNVRTQLLAGILYQLFTEHYSNVSLLPALRQFS